MAAIETGIPASLYPDEIRHVPLPASSEAWDAKTAPEWLKHIKSLPAQTLDDALSFCFAIKHHQPEHSSAFGQSGVGPFGRTCVAMTLLRGVQSITRKLRPDVLGSWSENVSEPACQRYSRALERWLIAWQSDRWCRKAQPGGVFAKSEKAEAVDSDESLTEQGLRFYAYAVHLMRLQPTEAQQDVDKVRILFAAVSERYKEMTIS